MNPDDKKLKMLNRLIDALDPEGFTTADFNRLFSVVIELVKKHMEITGTKMAEMDNMLASGMSRMHFTHESNSMEMKKTMQKELEGMKQMYEQVFAKIEQKFQAMQDAKDADEQKIVQDILAQIPAQKDIILDTPIQLRDKLESLPDGEKLSIQAIQDLAQKLEELEKRPMGRGQAFGSIRTRYIDDETPTGTVDGNNTTFTISKTPVTGSLKVYRGGARQRVTEDYTFSGRTITFTLAPQVGEVLLVDFRY